MSSEFERCTTAAAESLAEPLRLNVEVERAIYTVTNQSMGGGVRVLGERTHKTDYLSHHCTKVHLKSLFNSQV